jgi:hypothetical protein
MIARTAFGSNTGLPLPGVFAGYGNNGARISTRALASDFLED